MRILLLLPGLLACTDPCPAGSTRRGDGLCYLNGDGAGDSGQVTDGADGGDGSDGADGADGSDGGDGGSGLDLTYGDPILPAGRQGTDASGGGGGELVEWVDAAMIDSRYGITVGQGGWQVVDLDTAERVYKANAMRGFRVATDGNLAAISTRMGQVLRVDVSDPTRPTEMAALMGDGSVAHEDVAVDAGRILVGWTTRGAILYDAEGRPTGTLPATHAFGVGLSGDRAVVTDLDTLILFDVSDPAFPVELDRQPMRGEGRDVSFDGDRVAVGIGGRGVDLFHIEDNALVLDGDLDIPGSSMGLSLDGDHLWVATWETVALAWVGEGGPTLLGLEPVSQSAFGVGARDGRALVADWFFASILEQVPGVAGPELVMEETVWLRDAGETLLLPVRNAGPMALTVDFSPPAGWTFDPSSLSLDPGARTDVRLTPPATLDRPRDAAPVVTNDPDESELLLQLWQPEGEIGAMHDPFTLTGVQMPDTTLQDYVLEDQRGKVVLLVYWALF